MTTMLLLQAECGKAWMDGNSASRLQELVVAMADAWGTPLKASLDTETRLLRIRSAGADRHWGTRDDLVEESRLRYR